MHDLVIFGGLVVREEGVARLDIAVSGERIAEIAPRVDAPTARRLDATGLYVLPGGIDPHVHLALPMKGTRSSDDPRTGTIAALFGGVTTLIDFTLQRPGQSPADSLRERLAEFEGRASCDYALHANLTDFPDRFGERLGGDLAELGRLGATSLKVFTAYSKEGMSITLDRLRTVLREAKARGFRVLVHAEDDRVVTEACAALEAAGRTGAADYPYSRPPEAETRAIEMVCEVAREVGAEVYFVHVSTAGGVAAVRRARGRAGASIFMETCPQYLALDDTRYAGPDGAQFLVAPPLRRPSDRAALLDALSNGEVDVVATDHCPFPMSDKDREGAPFFELPNGLPGIETRLPLLHEIAVRSGRMTMERLAEVTSTAPARIFGLYPRKGCISTGSDADLVLFDSAASWVIQPCALHMATDFSPYAGTPVTGRVVSVVLRGAVTIDGGELTRSACGHYLPRTARGLGRI